MTTQWAVRTALTEPRRGARIQSCHLDHKALEQSSAFSFSDIPSLRLTNVSGIYTMMQAIFVLAKGTPLWNLLFFIF